VSNAIQLAIEATHAECRALELPRIGERDWSVAEPVLLRGLAAMARELVRLGVVEIDAGDDKSE